MISEDSSNLNDSVIFFLVKIGNRREKNRDLKRKKKRDKEGKERKEGRKGQREECNGNFFSFIILVIYHYLRTRPGKDV